MNGEHKPEAVFRIRGEKIFWGPGLMELLERIAETGSVKAAAADMYMSYAKARRLISLAENELGVRIIESKRGGADHGGAVLTEEGKKYVQACRIIQNKLQSYCETLFEKYL